MFANNFERARVFFHLLLKRQKTKCYAHVFFIICARFLILRWRVWRIILVLFAPMSLQTLGVRVKSAAAFERHFSRRTGARQRRAAIVGRLRQFCKKPFDGIRYTWPRNDASQLDRRAHV